MGMVIVSSTRVKQAAAAVMGDDVATKQAGPWLPITWLRATSLASHKARRPVMSFAGGIPH